MVIVSNIIVFLLSENVVLIEKILQNTRAHSNTNYAAGSISLHIREFAFSPVSPHQTGTGDCRGRNISRVADKYTNIDPGLAKFRS